MGCNTYRLALHFGFRKMQGRPLVARPRREVARVSKRVLVSCVAQVDSST